MSLYNALFGVNNASPILLKIIGKTEKDFGRFRDCYLSEDGTKIIAYTRCGGGNREDYEFVFEEMEQHPNYINNYDDDFDCTYAYIEFSVPDEYKEDCKQMASETGEVVSPTERFQQLITDLQAGKDTPEVKQAVKVAEPLMNKIIDALDSGENKIIEV